MVKYIYLSDDMYKSQSLEVFVIGPDTIIMFYTLLLLLAED